MNTTRRSFNGKRRAAGTSAADRWFFGSVLVLVLGLAAATLWLSLAGELGRKVIATGDEVRIPLKKVNQGKLEMIPYAVTPSRTMEIAVQKGKDGVIRASFAACRSCQRAAHYVSSGVLICGHCRHTIKLPETGQVPSSKSDCIPVALAFTTSGDELRIPGQSVLAAFNQWYEPRTGLNK